jgi:hypothetical protein
MAQPSLAGSLRQRANDCSYHTCPVQWFLDGGVFPSLLRLLKTDGRSEDEVMLRVKGILAISALVRHSAPGQAAFLQHQGAQLLGRLTADKDARVQRWVGRGGVKVLDCIWYCCFLSSLLSSEAILPSVLA